MANRTAKELVDWSWINDCACPGTSRGIVQCPTCMAALIEVNYAGTSQEIVPRPPAAMNCRERARLIFENPNLPNPSIRAIGVVADHIRQAEEVAYAYGKASQD